MSKVEHSDTELSLRLSDSLTTDTQVKKKKKYKKKKSSKKHTVECHRCHETFRTTEKADRYSCPSCQSKPALIVLPIRRATIPNLSTLSIQEDEEDICPVCDTDCTCGTSAVEEPVIEPPKDNVVERIGVATKKKPKKKSKKKKEPERIVTNVIQKIHETDEDEDVVIDDLDDLLDTMSPLSDQGSEHESIQLFTDESEPIDLDGGAKAEINEPPAITDDTTDTSSDEIMYIEDDDDDDEDEDEDEEDDDDDDDDDESDDDEANNEEEEEDIENYIRVSHWSTDEEEEDEEDTFSLSGHEEVSFTTDNPTAYNNIVSAFMHALAPNDPGGAESHGANTPIARESEQLSAFELANALSLLSSFESENQTDLLRRPSLPSSAVSAAQRHRGSQDFDSETLCTLSNIITDDLSLSYDPTHASSSTQIDTPPSTSLQEQLSEFLKSNTAVENKKRQPRIKETVDNSKKRRLSLATDEPTKDISMDDLLDTSQLHSDEENNDQDHPYSRDLSRWQRIPIGAFRLMRSKNKLWLER